MHHFEYGFFNELEKIATNKDKVAWWKKAFQKDYPGASRAIIGELATGMVQRMSPGAADLVGPGIVTIPKPGAPGERVVANPEITAKFIKRIPNKAGWRILNTPSPGLYKDPKFDIKKNLIRLFGELRPIHRFGSSKIPDLPFKR